MPTYIDAVKFEEEAPAGNIRLVKSGEFYRAYNHSAWLFCCCIAEYKVMRKFVKALNMDVYYVGFPERSLFNNIGERRLVKSDLGFDIELVTIHSCHNMLKILNFHKMLVRDSKTRTKI